MPHDINSDTAISLFAEYIRRELGPHLRRLILFGSYARGDATEDSDYDCLVVVDEVNRERQIGDYDFDLSITNENAKEDVEHARVIVTAIEQYLRKESFLSEHEESGDAL